MYLKKEFVICEKKKVWLYGRLEEMWRWGERDMYEVEICGFKAVIKVWEP